jgi:hypothetical protein
MKLLIVGEARNQHGAGSNQPACLEETCSSETSVDLERSTPRYIPEDRTFNDHCWKDLKSCNFTVLSPLQLVKSHFYGTQRFFTMYTEAQCQALA